MNAKTYFISEWFIFEDAMQKMIDLYIEHSDKTTGFMNDPAYLGIAILTRLKSDGRLNSWYAFKNKKLFASPYIQSDEQWLTTDTFTITGEMENKFDSDYQDDAKLGWLTSNLLGPSNTAFGSLHFENPFINVIKELFMEDNITVKVSEIDESKITYDNTLGCKKVIGKNIF